MKLLARSEFEIVEESLLEDDLGGYPSDEELVSDTDTAAPEAEPLAGDSHAPIAGGRKVALLSLPLLAIILLAGTILRMHGSRTPAPAPVRLSAAPQPSHQLAPVIAEEPSATTTSNPPARSPRRAVAPHRAHGRRGGKGRHRTKARRRPTVRRGAARPMRQTRVVATPRTAPPSEVSVQPVTPPRGGTPTRVTPPAGGTPASQFGFER